MATVWFIAGLATGVLTCWFAPRLWPRARALARARHAYLIAGGLVAAFAVAAISLQFALSSRHNGGGEAAHAAAAAPAAAGAPSAAAQSMDAAIARLESRLAREGGSDGDWELLAKAYEFLGRGEDAKRARAHAVTPSSGPTGAGADTASMESLAAAAAIAGNATGSGSVAAPAPVAPAAVPAASLGQLQRRVHDHPDDVSAWLALAELYRARHDNRPARDALARVVALHGMTAQSWADYADVLGSLAGDSLTGAAGDAIDQALALDPNNAKALWLKASQAHEQRHFADALTFWHRLRAVLPADSPDGRIIDANIAEDTQLAGTATAPQSAGVSGTVSIDSRLASRVQRDATLFIYAKAADSPGPPLAVLRTRAASWPVPFRLDDSMAMMPSRRLSQFDKVVVEARISRSGQATPGSGDLFVTSPAVNPGTGPKLALVIDREIN